MGISAPGKARREGGMKVERVNARATQENTIKFLILGILLGFLGKHLIHSSVGLFTPDMGQRR